MNAEIRPLHPDDVDGAVALQVACFPPPFDPELLWKREHLLRHLELFPEGQFVAVAEGRVIGSCSNTLVSDAVWNSHASWDETVGGPFLDNFDPLGSTLYGLDISVHPEARGQGLAKRLYAARFELVRSRGLARYGTACRLPDWRAWSGAHSGADHDSYVAAVQRGETTDRTLSPLLRIGLTPLGVLHHYMEDWESGNAAALLEWKITP